MKRYKDYKESGIDWLGEIPKEWRIGRGRDLFLKMKREVRPEDETITCFRSGLVTLRSNVRTDGFTNSAHEHGYQGIRKGDLIIHEMDAFAGALGISDSDGKGSPILMVLRCSNGVENYYRYLLKAMSSKGYIYALWKGIRVRTVDFRFSTFRDLFFPSPSIKEQKSISDYLDKKTNAIDKKIDFLIEKIDLYESYKKSIISQAVTKGLDKKTKQQNTEIGISVCFNWQRFRLKDIGKLYSGLSGKSGEDFQYDTHQNNRHFIRFTNIADNIYLSRENLGTVIIEPHEKQNKVKKGDIFFLMSSEGYDDIGKSAVLRTDLENTYLNSFCKGYRLTNKSINPYFLNYLLLSEEYRELLMIEGKGFTRINLKMEKVNDFIVYLPPSAEEQNEIVQFLDKKTEIIDNVIESITAQIEHLKLLRVSLINDVVTGKIKIVE